MRPKSTLAKVAAAILAIVAAYVGLFALAHESPMVAWVAAVGLIGAVALFSADPRSRYVVYSSAFVVAASWLLWAWLSLSTSSAPDIPSLALLVMQAVLLAVCCGGAVVHVAYHFRGSHEA